MTRTKDILEAVTAGRPTTGPRTVHVDVTNACNAACITCWDHSPLLETPRSPLWKKKRLGLGAFREIVRQLVEFGSVQSMILSGMGDPLVHPEIYEMIAAVKAEGWHLTVLSNLIAADIDRLTKSGIDQLLVGVHGASPVAYSAFHPGWDEYDFATLCKYLRAVRHAGITCRHVQVINRDTAADVVAMVRFGKQFAAERVNYKLASLYGGTETCSVTPEQTSWLLDEAIPQARELATELGVHTNLDLFERQVAAASGHMRSTTPIEDVGCFMGYVYTRITVERDVLYCCNTNLPVGNLADADLHSLWYGPAWQALRNQLRQGQYAQGCDKCGKFEQNVKWSEKYREYAGEAAWNDAVGRRASQPPHVPRTPSHLPVVS